MALKRVIMILAASLEFEKKYNSEVVERQSDNEEVPHVRQVLLLSNICQTDWSFTVNFINLIYYVIIEQNGILPYKMFYRSGGKSQQ